MFIILVIFTLTGCEKTLNPKKHCNYIYKRRFFDAVGNIVTLIPGQPTPSKERQNGFTILMILAQIEYDKCLEENETIIHKIIY